MGVGGVPTIAKYSHLSTYVVVIIIVEVRSPQPTIGLMEMAISKFLDNCSKEILEKYEKHKIQSNVEKLENAVKNLESL